MTFSILRSVKYIDWRGSLKSVFVKVIEMNKNKMNLEQ